MAGSDALMKLLDATLVAVVVHGVDAFGGGGIRAWCELNGISRATFYRHQARVKAEGSYRDRSRRPLTSPGATPAEVVEHVVRLRNELVGDNGAKTIRYHLGLLAAEQDWPSRGLVLPSIATIHKILRRAGLVVAQPKKRPKSSWRRFCYARPRDCYQIDATITALAGGANVVVFEVLDDCTRLLVATLAAPAETSTAAIQAIKRAFAAYGVPSIVLSDNGSAFTSRYTGGGLSRFTRAVITAGTRLIHSSPYHPQTCGKVERHHRTFKAWLALQDPPQTLSQLQALCDTYQDWYNTVRPHSAHGTTPAQAWDRALELGGPQHLPVQQDAQVLLRTVNHVGVVRFPLGSLTIGLPFKGQQVTLVLDGHHLTAYDYNGHPLGHLVLNHAKRHQGKLIAA